MPSRALEYLPMQPAGIISPKLPYILVICEARSFTYLTHIEPMSSPTPFPSPSPSTLVIDRVTILSLLATLILLIIAYLASLRLLRPRTTLKFRILFIWHAFDALIHLILESAFLYNCFFTYTSILSSSDYPHPASLTSPGVYFLGRKDRLYGSNYGSNPMAKVWQEYAKADSRWGGADLTVISLEILTVCIGGPLAVYVCELIRRGDREGGGAGGKLWFWATVLATGELYGGECPTFLFCVPAYDKNKTKISML